MGNHAAASTRWTRLDLLHEATDRTPVPNRCPSFPGRPFSPHASALCCRGGVLSAVQLLIASRADVLAKDHHAITPLHLAAVTGSSHVLDALVEAEADVHAESRFGRTAVDQASITRHHHPAQKLEQLGSKPPMWRSRRHALDEFVKLSPCPQERYTLHLTFWACAARTFLGLDMRCTRANREVVEWHVLFLGA